MNTKKAEPLVGLVGLVEPEDNGPIIAIEYDRDGKPCNVSTAGDEYAFVDTPYGWQWENCGSEPANMEYSIWRRDEPDQFCKLWLADGVGLKRWVEHQTYVPVERAEVMDYGYEIIAEPLDLTSMLHEFERKKGETTVNPFDVAEESDNGFAWCSICETHFPDESDCYCQHIFYIDNLHGCGSNEVRRDDHKESVFAVLEKTGIAGPLRRAMVNSDYGFGYHGSILGVEGINVCLDEVNYGERFTADLTDEQEEQMSIGVGWLGSLEPGETRGYELLTIKWIDEWLGVRDERAKEKELLGRLKGMKSKGIITNIDRWGFIFGKEKGKDEIVGYGLDGEFDPSKVKPEEVKRYETLEAMVEAAEKVARVSK